MNPGPGRPKPTCKACLKTIRRNQRVQECIECLNKFHFKCVAPDGTKTKINQARNVIKNWLCFHCLHPFSDSFFEDESLQENISDSSSLLNLNKTQEDYANHVVKDAFVEERQKDSRDILMIHLYVKTNWKMWKC